MKLKSLYDQYISVKNVSISIGGTLLLHYFIRSFQKYNAPNFENDYKVKDMGIIEFKDPIFSEETKESLKPFSKIYGNYFFSSAPQFFTNKVLKVNDGIRDQLISASYEIHSMCMEVVERVANDDALLELFEIPDNIRDLVKYSWKNRQTDLMGRFDFVYDPKNKLLKLCEYNADTPTTLVESAKVQELLKIDLFKNLSLTYNTSSAINSFNFLEKAIKESWKRQLFPSDADNKLSRFANIISNNKNFIKNILFLTCTANSEELTQTEYMRSLVRQVIFNNKNSDPNQHTKISDISNLNYTKNLLQNDYLYTEEDKYFKPDIVWKLYPLEYMSQESVADFLESNYKNVNFIEPAWKLILSSKALLPFLWEMFPEHPHLLPAYFVDPKKLDNEQAKKDVKNNFIWVTKPKFGREGESIAKHYIRYDLKKYSSLMDIDDNKETIENISKYNKITDELDRLNNMNENDLSESELEKIFELTKSRIEGKDIAQAFVVADRIANYYPTLSTWIVMGLPVGFSARVCKNDITNTKANYIPVHHDRIASPITLQCTERQNLFRNELYNEDNLKNINLIYGESKELLNKQIILPNSEYFKKYHEKSEDVSNCHCGGSCPSYRASRSSAKSKEIEKTKPKSVKTSTQKSLSKLKNVKIRNGGVARRLGVGS